MASIPAQTMGVGVFTETLLDVLDLSRIQLSFAYLAGTLASGFLIPMGGRWIDRLGIRKTLCFSSAALGLSLILLSISDWLAAKIAAWVPLTVPWLIPFFIVTIGFFLIRYWGQGILTLASRNMVGKWFDHRRGLAVGISGVAVGLTFSASPTILNALIRWIGWRESWILLGLLLLFGMSGFAWLFSRDNPEECGLQMDGGKRPLRDKQPNPDLFIHHEFTRSETIRTFAFWSFSLAFSWHALFFTAYTFHVVDIGRSIGLPRQEIFILFLYASIVSIVTNLTAGWISGWIRIKWLLLIQNLSMFSMALGLLIGDPTLTPIFIVISLGVSGGLWSNLSGTVYPRFFGRAHLGSIAGLSMSMLVVGSAIGPYMFSLSEALSGSYRGGYYAGLVIATVLMAAAFRSDNPQRKLSSEGTG